MLDICPGMCYYNIRKRKYKKIWKENKKMATSIEMMEIWGDAMDELRDWEAFEADLAEGDPWA